MATNAQSLSRLGHLSYLTLWHNQEALTNFVHGTAGLSSTVVHVGFGRLRVRKQALRGDYLVSLPSAVLQRLGDVGRVNAVGVVKVGDCAGDLQDPMVCAGREV